MEYIKDMTGCEVHDAMVNIIHHGPHILQERIGDENGYTQLRSIITTTATAQEDIDENIRINLKSNFTKFNHHPEFQKIKGNTPIAIVGGGPSLEDNLYELSQLDTKIIVAGSPHDYLLKNGIVPDYCAACDADIAVNNYFKTYSPSTEYLIASCCDPRVFEHLKNNKVYMWHCFSDRLKEWFDKNIPGEHLIGGGCTIGSRCINLGIMLGYTNFHLFGFDSCMKGNKHHSYNFVEESEKLGLGNIYTIKIGKNGEKTYNVAGYQLAQAEHFRSFLQHYHHMVSFTFHGDGLLRDVYDDFIQVNHLENRV